MHLLVAGAGGAVGRRLVLLLAAGHRVTGTSRGAAGAERLRAAGADGVVVDALDAAGLRATVVAAAPDAVVHMLTDLSTADGAANGRLRRAGTRNLVDAARTAGVGRLVAQSIAWCTRRARTRRASRSRSARTPARRAARWSPRWTRWSGRRSSWEAVVLRFGVLYGPGTWYAPDGAAARRGEPGRRLSAAWRRTRRSAPSCRGTTRRRPSPPHWTGRLAR